MAELITLKDCLIEMDKGMPFSVSFCTLDKRRGKGGERVSFDNCQLSRDVQKQLPKGHSSLRRANNNENAIRNVMLPSGKIRSFHIRLIESFNGKEVIY